MYAPNKHHEILSLKFFYFTFSWKRPQRFIRSLNVTAVMSGSFEVFYLFSEPSYIDREAYLAIERHQYSIL